MRFSHASAIVEQGRGSAKSKIRALREAGAIVVDRGYRGRPAWGPSAHDCSYSQIAGLAVAKRRVMCLLRSMLFTPANNERMMAKAPTRGADAVILDLEDAVPMTEKAAARRLAGQWLARPRSGGVPTSVRVNALSTDLTVDDLHEMVQIGLGGIMLPKAESAADLVQVSEWITRLETQRGMEPEGLCLIPLLRRLAEYSTPWRSRWPAGARWRWPLGHWTLRGTLVPGSPPEAPKSCTHAPASCSRQRWPECRQSTALGYESLTLMA